MNKLNTTQRNELWNRLSDLLAQEGPLYADMDDDEADDLLTKFIDGIERGILPMVENAPAKPVPAAKHEGPGHAYGDIFWCPGCLAEFRANQAKAEESL